ncbi:RimJ/RimL family protein N-acetyltransferase [Nocardia tenerifensis]|uniref:RimJ/RimL family protein N-acetyltransferase n=1 Tax=Nocardia tenerifensis TaxID=228006 RepID=A0A318JY48_9NOCA|nr:GNAT family N-acetyltransferase [Nocardia tenerifensis]PXX63182.1 RimJ/RimL family protein N-acetyltransferase [Nocardia tenerifensis]
MHRNTDTVGLEPLTEGNLALLLDAAVAEAHPLEVMPPIAGAPGWNAERRRAFLEFHRGRALADQPVEYTYVITVGGRVVGAARLQPGEAGLEAGVWIGRSDRGRGVGGVVAERLRAIAAEIGARRIVAVTTVGNTAARRLLGAANSTVDGDTVTATVALE